jgi:sarcosine oxidase subunit gamma
MTAWLMDCSDRARIGLKGPRAAEWLEQLGCDVPALSNSWRAIREQRGSLIARLGSTEFFLEEPRPGVFVRQVADALRSPVDGVYPVLREDRSLVLSGAGANDVLAQACNVEFEQVSRSERQVVMTMMIGIAVLVIPDRDPASSGAREANGGCYRIWCDPSYGDYLWSSLQDVMRGA